jgi:hypothetical protein
LSAFPWLMLAWRVTEKPLIPVAGYRGRKATAAVMQRTVISSSSQLPPGTVELRMSGVHWRQAGGDRLGMSRATNARKIVQDEIRAPG